MYIAKLSKVPYRIRIDCLFHAKKATDSIKIEAIIDSGCANTLIPLWAAEQCGGKPLPMEKEVRIAGNTRNATAYIIPAIEIGGFVFYEVFAYAAEFQDELKDRILLGLNVLNNWDYRISRARGVLEFEEAIPADVPNKENPYRNYFDERGNYVMLTPAV